MGAVLVVFRWSYNKHWGLLNGCCLGGLFVVCALVLLVWGCFIRCFAGVLKVRFIYVVYKTLSKLLFCVCAGVGCLRCLVCVLGLVWCVVFVWIVVFCYCFVYG